MPQVYHTPHVSVDYILVSSSRSVKPHKKLGRFHNSKKDAEKQAKRVVLRSMGIHEDNIERANRRMVLFKREFHQSVH